MVERNPRIVNQVAVISPVIALLIALLYFAGQQLGIPTLTQILPNSPAMARNTAVALIPLSLAELVWHARRPQLRSLVALLTLPPLFIGLMTSLGYLLSIEPTINRLLLAPRMIRPSPETAFSLTLLSFAILLMATGRHMSVRAGELLAGGAEAIALLSLTGHLTGVPALHSLFSPTHATGMALNSTIAMILLSLSALLLSPRGEIASLLSSTTAGGIMLRKLLASLMLAPILIEVCAGALARHGIFEPPARHAFSLVMLLAAFAAMTWVTARRLDLTDRASRIAEGRLKASEERYRQLVNLAPDGIFTADLEGRYTDVNEAGCKLLGVTREDIVGKTILDLIPPEEAQRLRASRTYLLSSGEALVNEWHLKRRDGKYIPVEVSAKILKDGNWLGFVRDISERKEAEAEIRSRQTQLDAFFDASPVGMALIDLQLRYIKINETLAYINGPSVAEHLGKTVSQVLPELAPNLIPFFEYIARTRKGLNNFDISGETPRDPGNRRHWIVSYFPINDWKGELALFGVTVMEVTALKRTEEALQKQAKDLVAYASEIEDLYNNAPCGYHSIGPDGTILMINDTELGWLGYSREEVIGRKRVQDFLSEEGRNVFASRFPTLVERGAVHDLKLSFVRKDGSSLPVLLNATAIRDRSGRYLMSRTTVFDYTEQSKLEREAQAALAARDEFLAVAAHDLRTPLTSLRLQTQLIVKALQGRKEPEPLLGLARQAKEQTDRLVRLMNDLLDLTRLRLGKLSLDLMEIDLAEAVREGVASFATELSDKQIQVSIQGEQSLKGNWDPLRIEQILANLLSNAIKYGKRRPIDIRLEASEDGTMARLMIRDQGIGIASDQLPKIFERYERAAEVKNISGLGLGLSITRQLVRAHGGRIWVESVPGEGSTFHVELPRNTQAIKAA